MFDKIKDFIVMRGVENKLDKIVRNPKHLQKIDIYNQILKPCDDIIAKNSNNYRAYCAKALLYYLMCDYENALNCYQKVHEKFIFSGFILNKTSRQRMLDCCDKLIEADPNNSKLYMDKADILEFTYSVYKPELVLKCYDKALSLNPENLVEIVWYKAEFLDEIEQRKDHNLNKHVTALTFFDEVIQSYPEHIVELISHKANFLYCYCETKDYDILSFFDESAQAYPQHSKEILAKKEEFIKSLEPEWTPDMEIPDFLRK